MDYNGLQWIIMDYSIIIIPIGGIPIEKTQQYMQGSFEMSLGEEKSRSQAGEAEGQTRKVRKPSGMASGTVERDVRVLICGQWPEGTVLLGDV